MELARPKRGKVSVCNTAKLSVKPKRGVWVCGERVTPLTCSFRSLPDRTITWTTHLNRATLRTAVAFVVVVGTAKCGFSVGVS